MRERRSSRLLLVAVDCGVNGTSGDNTEGYIGGTGNLSLADGVKITVVRNDRSGALLRFTPTE
jgi:hypothetical protein